MEESVVFMRQFSGKTLDFHQVLTGIEDPDFFDDVTNENARFGRFEILVVVTVEIIDEEIKFFLQRERLLITEVDGIFFNFVVESETFQFN